MSRPPRFKFRLYVAADTQNSVRATANLNAFCRDHLLNRHEIEVVDVLREPKRAMADAIFMTPTLVKLFPVPIRSLIGTLSQPQLLLETFGLEAAPA
jgi:circadian clock protein KaiB